VSFATEDVTCAMCGGLGQVPVAVAVADAGDEDE
jgi:hypothetical protein